MHVLLYFSFCMHLSIIFRDLFRFKIQILFGLLGVLIQLSTPYCTLLLSTATLSAAALSVADACATLYASIASDTCAI